MALATPAAQFSRAAHRVRMAASASPLCAPIPSRAGPARASPAVASSDWLTQQKLSLALRVAATPARPAQLRVGIPATSRSIAVRASVATEPAAAPSSKSIGIAGADAVLQQLQKVPIPWQWQWQAPGSGAKETFLINAVEYRDAGSPAATGGPTVLLLPALSDVAVVDEWDAVAACLLSQGPSLAQRFQALAGDGGSPSLRVVSVDFPGFGLSDRPGVLYTAQLLEDFLADFVKHISPGSGAGKQAPVVVVGAGHAATIALKAVADGRIAPLAVAAVAPTWAGPLPIVFGRDETVQSRYNLLRSAIRSPGLGWAMYKYALTSPKNIRMQYLTHVYAEADNVSPELITQRTDITQRPGARFAPASFLTGLLDPVTTREGFLALFDAAGKASVPVGVVVSEKSPKRSRKEMEALQGASGVSQYSVVPGALLPHEEYPAQVFEALSGFFSSNAIEK